jgi:hypothetical protein
VQQNNARVANLRHRLRRENAHETVIARLVARWPEFGGLKLGQITPGALSAWRRWPEADRAWNDWEKTVAKYRKRYARLEMAIWYGEPPSLCALAIGRFSTGRQILSVNLVKAVSRRPAPLRGQILFVVAEVALALAAAYGASIVRFTEPSEAVRQRLTNLGFRYVARRTGLPYDFSEREVFS